jgi:DNA-binding NtrC family response regulator
VGPAGTDDGTIVTVSSPARVLLIADDPQAGETYRRVLEFVGYEVSQVANFVDALGTRMSDADIIVLCNLAALVYPGQGAQVIRIPEGTAPDVLVTEVYRRLAPRPEFTATQAAR